LGRHASPPPKDRSGPGRELILWGLFSVPLTVGALGLIGGDWTLALLVGGLELVVFGVVWLAVVGSRPIRVHRDDEDGGGDGPIP
jgi:hypothetical protein